MSAEKIGFIGLGLMGTPMALRLLERGHQLTVMGHRDRAGIEKAVAQGASEANSAREMAEAVDIVML